MLQPDGGKDLVTWLDAMPTDLARARAAMGAAEALWQSELRK
jgi:hypothetical protein